jgi:hypothetical protein
MGQKTMVEGVVIPNKFIKYRYGQTTAFTGRAKNARHL